MKLITTVLLVLLAIVFAGNTSDAQTVVRKQGYTMNFDERDFLTYIVTAKFDSTFNLDPVSVEKWKDSLSQKTVTYFYRKEGNVKAFERFDVFDNGLLIYSAIKDNGRTLSAYSYSYDTKGRLIKYSGHGSGDSGSTTFYYYK